LTVIAEETQRLEELAASFAMLGRPAEGPRSPVDVIELFQQLLASDVPGDVEIEITGTTEPQVVHADYNALLRAFRNVVRNAVEAIDQNGRVRQLYVDVRRMEGNRVRIAIRDSGPGLSEAAQERLFEPDFTTKIRGTGLGLAVARQTFRMHGGDIEAQNVDGGGAEFIVDLPLLSDQSSV
jgi:signal transduction histidine kinase